MVSSLLELSEDVINEILHWVCPIVADPLKTTPDFCFCQNALWYEPSAFHDLLLLSSTCIALRRLVGPRIFSDASLVRRNEEAVILRTPREQSRIEEHTILQFADQLMGLNTSFTFNNYVEYLECPVSTVSLQFFGLQFPCLKALKVLSNGQSVNASNPVQNWQENSTPNIRPLNLNYLASNAIVIYNTPCLLASVGKLHRLDLLVDLSELAPGTEINAITRSIEDEGLGLIELNLFMTSIEALTHKEILSLVAAAAPLLEKLSIRTVRRAHLFAPKMEWDVGSVTGRDILHLINDKCQFLRLLTIGDEVFTCFQFVLPGLLYSRKRPLDLTYVRRPPTSFAFQGQDNLVAFTVGVGATRFHLLYFDTELLRHHNQIDLVLILLSMVSLEYGYQNINQVTIENCWSYENDSIMRDKFEDNRDHRSSLLRRQLASIHPWTRLSLNTPYHKQREAYSVTYYERDHEQYPELVSQMWRFMLGFAAMVLASSHNPLPQIRPLADNSGTEASRRDFWGVETALLELEHYCLRERQKSRLWD